MVTSTSEVYGSALYTPIDESHPKQAQSPYSASKIAADVFALSFYYSFDLPVTIVRPFNTYGPRQSDRAIIPAIICQALTKRETASETRPQPATSRFVTDTVEGMLQVAEAGRSAGQEINLGTGQEISIGDLASLIAELIGTDIAIRRDAERSRPAKSEVTRLLSANARARELAGWTPKVTLEEGLKLTIDWVRSHLGLYDPGAYRI